MCFTLTPPVLSGAKPTATLLALRLVRKGMQDFWDNANVVVPGAFIGLWSILLLLAAFQIAVCRRARMPRLNHHSLLMIMAVSAMHVVRVAVPVVLR